MTLTTQVPQDEVAPTFVQHSTTSSLQHNPPLYEDLPPKAREVRIGRGYILLPDDKLVTTTRLGKGTFATVYSGDDGWVYSFLRPDARDPAKEVAMEAWDTSKGKPWRKHLPAFAKVGWADAAGNVFGSGRVYPQGNRFEVFRSPLYFGLTRKELQQSKKLRQTACQIDLLREVERTTRSSFDWHVERDAFTNERFTHAFLRYMKGTKGILPSLRGAIRQLVAETDNYRGTWIFEFPSRNLAVDAKGNLVLLDVIFDRKALDKARGYFS